MNILVLYSWENNYKKAQSWAMALCLELQRYESITAECDMLFAPQSDKKQEIKDKILNADRILVIVSRSYIEKIEKKGGMVSFEEEIYKDILTLDKENNKIAFILKEKNIIPPKGWEAYERFDLSDFNELSFYYLSQKEICARIDQIIRFFTSTPEFTLPTTLKKKRLPKSKRVYFFRQIFNPQILEQLSPSEQERRLVHYITNNSNQETFAYQYIKSGLSADSNLGNRMTPELFIKHFLVKRTDAEEQKYNNTIKELFSSDHHNMFCLQSDGGSGKSTFIQTLGYKTEHQTQKNSVNHNIIFDLSNLSENSAAKEEAVFQKLKKIYRKMLLNDPDPAFFLHWRESFVNKAKAVRNSEFITTDLFDLTEFQISLNHFLEIITPLSEIDNWYLGYSKRLHKAKDQEETNILFIILFMVYLLILDSKPSICKKQERYTIIFDNIETYDNGEFAKNISKYIERCYAFIKKVFTDINLYDDFFKRFTFVIVIRTSTLIHFGNLQGDIWGGGRYIKHISFFDFTTEALIKKLLFLKRIKDYETTILYKKVYQFLLLIMPESSLKTLSSTLLPVDPVFRHFTTHRLLPLFNNDFRRALGYLNRSILSEENYEQVKKKIQSVNKTDQIYNFGIYGLRMKVFREIFDDFQSNGYFSIMHFNDSVGNNCSVTRMILSFLYWDEVRFFSTRLNEAYIGVPLYNMIKVFNKFWDIKQISKTLYGLSVFSNKSPKQKEVLSAWGYLLVYNNFYYDFDENDFCKIIETTAKRNTSKIKVNRTEIDTSNIYVKLSDAGMCFVQYYIRNFEFIMARSKLNNMPSLFFIEDKSDVLRAIENVYKNLSSCLEETMAPFKSNCKLYNITKRGCISKCTKANNNMFLCPFFFRYQECLDLIRESIWYIDRYRIVYYTEHEDSVFNTLLLSEIEKYYFLYEKIRSYILETKFSKENVLDFIKQWEYPQNKQYANLIPEEKYHSNRTEIIRPIQSYFARQDEQINQIVVELEKAPKKTVYGTIIEQNNTNKGALAWKKEFDI